MQHAVGADNAGMLLASLTELEAGSGGLTGVGADTLRHALRTIEAGAEAAAWVAAEPRLAGGAAAGFTARRPGRLPVRRR
ncbi:hypothetical protein [Streptomyces sp. NPDC052107]|uniref:hypothetical protein n=1 Tax=Streptomyces sp. NPDC052107 TaxID=3155632 RepID=UPI0034207211